MGLSSNTINFYLSNYNMLKLYPIKLYIRNSYTKIAFVINITVNISIWVWLLIYIRPQEDPIFLHYNVLFGVDFIGAWWKMLFLPLSGIFIILTNLLLGWLLFSYDKFISHLLNTISVLLQLFILVASILLVFINI